MPKSDAEDDAAKVKRPSYIPRDITAILAILAIFAGIAVAVGVSEADQVKHWVLITISIAIAAQGATLFLFSLLSPWKERTTRTAHSREPGSLGEALYPNSRELITVALGDRVDRPMGLGLLSMTLVDVLEIDIPFHEKETVIEVRIEGQSLYPGDQNDQISKERYRLRPTRTSESSKLYKIEHIANSSHTLTLELDHANIIGKTARIILTVFSASWPITSE